MSDINDRPPREPGQEPTAVLTRDAYDRLRAELEQLITGGRARIAERLERAREHGDIRENAEYDAVKDEQGLMEARIREIERMLRDPEILEGPEATEEAVPGVLVHVRPLDGDEDEDGEQVFLLAASKEERHDGARTVSLSSPLGQALAGRKVGETVEYQAPGGTFSYEIVALATPS